MFWPERLFEPAVGVFRPMRLAGRLSSERRRPYHRGEVGRADADGQVDHFRRPYTKLSHQIVGVELKAVVER